MGKAVIKHAVLTINESRGDIEPQITRINGSALILYVKSMQIHPAQDQIKTL